MRKTEVISASHNPRYLNKERESYELFTKIDTSMQCYAFELDDKSKELCIIAMPFGKYKYNRPPMGLKCSPDIAQQVMENICRHIDDK